MRGTAVTGRPRGRGWLAAVAVVVAAGLAPTAAAPRPVPALRVPPGFSIEVWAEGLPDARTLVRGDQGTVFVGTRREGAIYALADRDGDGRPEARWQLAQGLDLPTGLAFRHGDLYVAEVGRIWKWPGIESRLDAPPARVLLRDDLPTSSHHGWRFIDFGPDGRLYVAIGAPCNVCRPERFGPGIETATITRMDADGRHWEVVARGVRNSVGFDWHPVTRQLWFTDNGRDWLGDESPDCELNRVTRAGEDFGFPYCHAGRVVDPEFAGPGGRGCADATPPVARLGAHVAPLGIAFLTDARLPEDYRGDLVVALHGSWNRSRKNGYRVDRLDLDGDRVLAQWPLVDGWLDGETARGRPADVLAMPDGSLLISDDLGGRLWRLRYRGS